MGHRALIIIEQEDYPGTYRTRGSSGGAAGAKHLGTDYETMTTIGSPHKGVHQSKADAAREKVDFLYHEAVYLARPRKPTLAYDTIWWRGAEDYVPSPGGSIGVGALVHLDHKGEAENYFRLAYDDNTDDMSAMQFHNYIRDSDFVGRVPVWSPLGGDDIRVGREYLPATA